MPASAPSIVHRKWGMDWQTDMRTHPQRSGQALPDRSPARQTSLNKKRRPKPRQPFGREPSGRPSLSNAGTARLKPCLGGRNRTRTCDLLNVSQTLSQLSYSPLKAIIGTEVTIVKRGPPLLYICSGAVMPIRCRAFANTILTARTSFRRARVISRSAGSEETTRQSR